MVADLNPAAFLPTTCPLLVVKVGSSLLVAARWQRAARMAGNFGR